MLSRELQTDGIGTGLDAGGRTYCSTSRFRSWEVPSVLIIQLGEEAMDATNGNPTVCDSSLYPL